VDAVAPQGAEPDELADAIAAAQAELRKAVQLGGMTNDPLRFALEGFALALGAMHKLFAVSAQHYQVVSADLDQRIEDAIARSRQPIDEEALGRLQRAAANGAGQHVVALARAHHRRTSLLMAGLLVGAAVASLAGGYWWGHAEAVASIHETEHGLATAFTDGPDAAAAWLNLMRWNNPSKALASCGGSRAYTEAGRRACSVPLWIAPPIETAPQ